MNIISISILSIISTVTILIIRKTNPEISMLIALAIGVLIGLFILKHVSPIIDEITNFLNEANVQNKYTKILLKCLGICYLCQFTSDACADAGEKALSSKIELCGKITILTLGLPLITDILKISLELMK